jgi:hypothetical protein
MNNWNFPALSIRQPWAELIMQGRKTLEIRTWKAGYRGPIWIHTGLHVDEALDTRFALRDLFRGGLIGVVELKSIEPVDEIGWEAWRDRHLDFGPFKQGLFVWVLSNPKRLHSPVRTSGRTGLYPLDPQLLSRLSAPRTSDELGQ